MLMLWRRRMSDIRRAPPCILRLRRRRRLVLLLLLIVLKMRRRTVRSGRTVAKVMRRRRVRSIPSVPRWPCSSTSIHRVRRPRSLRPWPSCSPSSCAASSLSSLLLLLLQLVWQHPLQGLVGRHNHSALSCVSIHHRSARIRARHRGVGACARDMTRLQTVETFVVRRGETAWPRSMAVSWPSAPSSVWAHARDVSGLSAVETTIVARHLRQSEKHANGRMDGKKRKELRSFESAWARRSS